MNSGLFDVVNVLPGNSPIAQAFSGRGGRAGRAGRVAAGRGGDAAPPHPLNDDAIASISGLADVKDVTPSIVVPIQIEYQDTSSFATARGVPFSARNDAIFQSPKYGTFLPNATDRACLLGLQLAETLAK